MRLPIATNLASRDGTTAKDGGCRNAVIETVGDISALLKRPGTFSMGAVGSGLGQLLACYNNQLKSIAGNTLADLLVEDLAPSDGVGNLHAMPTTPDGSWISAAWSGAEFVAINQGSTVTARSTDGLTWSSGGALPFTPTGGTWASIAYGAGLFVALPGSDSSKRYATSSNGVSWTQRTFSTALANCTKVRFLNGLFIAMTLTGSFKTSPDGLTWTDRSFSSYPAGAPIVRDVAYGAGVYVFASISDTTSVDYTSRTADFSTWTHNAQGFNDGIAFDGAKFVLINRATSSDGSAWTTQTPSIPAVIAGNIITVEFGGGLFVMASDNDIGELYSLTSTDGFNWTLLAGFGGSVEFAAIAYGGGVFVALSDFSDYAARAYPLDGTPGTSGGIGATVQSSQPITSIDPDLPFFAQVAGQAQSQNVIVFKNAKEAWTYNGTTLSKITDADYPGWSVVTPTSITRSGAVVTVTLPAAVNWQSGSSVTIAGAAQAEYNGTVVISVTDATHFTFTVTGTPATPATGTITAKGGRTTVPGIVYLDGYFFVMDQNAVIYNCGLGAPTNWSALDFLTANIEPGSGVAIAKAQNYIIALKSWSTEFFYDAGNAVGSPLSPVMNAFTLIGCASGDSVANIDGTIAWVSKTRQKGRAVHIMAGLEQQKVSTPDIERILNADALTNVYSYGVKISGHTFYVLGLKDSGLTLVYDFTSQSWAQWTSLTAQATKPCTITAVDGVATVTCAAHGYADGDPVTITGAAQAEYNGTQQARYVDANTFKFAVAGSPASPATGTITAMGYTESYFKFTKYVYCSGRDLVLHETTGKLCEITEAVYQDSGNPINFLARTGKIDGDSIERKTNSQLKVIGNKIGGIAMVRWSDDDYTTSAAYRPLDLSSEQARLSRLGSFRRRSYELRHVGNSPVQVSALELDISQEK